ncbi:unnamed protein product [Protopolystoma xenopodis]|uniref:Uncharacterized protein n=1 Tax=Protopolystoma xenopodis TaxID=117903 RepID=A0A448WAA1_9PLAT|nr:unnamed protein product [Protopolystoma xenopodis]
MPNTQPALTDLATFSQISRLAEQKACCDYGLYAGATRANCLPYSSVSSELLSTSQVAALCHKVVGLKMYMNQSFNSLDLSDSMSEWRRHFQVNFFYFFLTL